LPLRRILAPPHSPSPFCWNRQVSTCYTGKRKSKRKVRHEDIGELGFSANSDEGAMSVVSVQSSSKGLKLTLEGVEDTEDRKVLECPLHMARQRNDNYKSGL
jgi:hypothetical protein